MPGWHLQGVVDVPRLVNIDEIPQAGVAGDRVEISRFHVRTPRRVRASATAKAPCQISCSVAEPWKRTSGGTGLPGQWFREPPGEL